MAIYHFYAQMIQRSKGRSIIAAAAYRRAIQLWSERESRSYDYTDKMDVIHSELSIPANSPEWVKKFLILYAEDSVAGAQQFWSFIDATEKQKNSQTAREFEFALPRELTSEQNIALAREFINDQFAGNGMIVDWSVHWEKGNPHVHALTTTRHIEEHGFGLKNIAWEPKSFLLEMRKQFAEYSNFHLFAHGHDVRIDHRSYKDQGIELIPTIHEGKAARQMRERGIETNIMKEANQIKQANLALIAQRPTVLLDKMTKQRDSFTLNDITHELTRYVTDKVSAEYSDGFITKEILSKVRDITATNDASLLEISAINPEPDAPFTSDAVLSPEKITALFKKIEAHDTVFSERTLIEHLSEFTDNADIFTRALHQIKNSPQLIFLGAGDDGRDRYTTRHLFDIENQLVNLTDLLREAKHIRFKMRLIQQGLTAYEKHTQKTLTSEQREVISHILKPSAVSCVVGRAGTGKSFTLGAVASVCELAGLRTTGVALSGIAADGLNQNGIPSRTIMSFIQGIDKGSVQLTDKDVVVMDEAGMTDVVSMIAVFNAVIKAGAKLILVGDHDQLQPVGGGAAFRAILERCGFAEITTVRRQKVGWQRDATKDFARGDVVRAMSAYDKHGFVHFDENQEDAMQQLAADWFSTYEKLKRDGEKQNHTDICPLQSAAVTKHMVVLAHTNDTVNKLNQLLRQRRVELKHMEQGHLTHNAERHKLYVAYGERIIFTQNSRRIGVENGQFGTITALNLTEGGEVLGFTALLDNGKKVQIDFKLYRHFAHSYAVTVHKSQGITRKWAFVFADGYGWNRHLSYVAHTRHEEGCRTYASKTEHRDKEALFKYLGRFGRKDSLIDFPLAFGLRRGFDMERAAKSLPKRLAWRLSELCDALQDKIQETFRPEHYWAEKQQVLANIEKNEVRQREREDGRLVANYVDANREVGRTFSELANVMHSLGFDKEHYFDAFADTFIQATSEYAAFEKAKFIRNEIAQRIASEPERYQHVMTTCGIELDKIESQSIAYQKKTMVMAYSALIAPTANQIVRERAAFNIFQEIKHYYHDIKNSHVDTAKLREEAFAHIRRKLFLILNSQQRTGFRLVERYKKLNSQIAQLLAEGETLHKIRDDNGSMSEKDVSLTHDNPSGFIAQNDDYLPLTRNHINRIALLGLERDSVAKQLVENAEVYSHALDFYHIGKADVRYDNEQITDLQKQKATERWYKLQNHAMRQYARDRVQAYQTAVEQKNPSLARELASIIVADIKSHHPLIMENTTDISGLWQRIRQDAKIYGQESYYKKLSPENQIIFNQVQSYLKAKKAHGTAWYEILIQKERLNLDSETVFKQLAPHTKRYVAERDELAAAIVSASTKTKDYLSYKAELARVDIDITTLTTQSDQHQRVKTVEKYKEARQAGASLPEKGKIAKEFLKETKKYYGLLVENGITWEEIFKDCRAYKAQAAMQFLHPVERKFLRTVREYKRINRQFGKTFARYQKNTTCKQLSADQSLVIAHLMSKRDYLACKIEQQAKIAYPKLALTAFESNHRIQAKKITAQANKHRERLQLIDNYQDVYRNVCDAIKPLYTALSSPHHKQYPSSIADQFQTAGAALAYAAAFKKVHWRILKENSLNPALQVKQLTKAQWQAEWEAIDNCKTILDKLVHLHERENGHTVTFSLPEKAIALEKKYEQVQQKERIDRDRLRALLNDQSERVALAYLGEPQKRSQKEWRYGKSGKLVVTHSGLKAGYWYNHQELKGGDMLSLISDVTGITSTKALAEEASSFLGGFIPMKSATELLQPKAAQKKQEKVQLSPKEEKTLQHIQAILNGTTAIEGTLAEQYLRQIRGVTSELSPELRYHPALKNWMSHSVHPALVVVARNEKNEMCGLQATFLDPTTGSKAELGNHKKLSRGKIATGALVHQGSNKDMHAYAEGLETALSVASAHPDWNVYVTFGVSNFASVPLNVSSENVILCADNDGLDSGTAKAVDRAALLLAEKGKNVYVALPPKPEYIQKYDFNDLLKDHGINAVKDALDNRSLYKAAITKDTLTTALAENLAVLTGDHLTVSSGLPDPMSDFIKKMTPEFVFNSHDRLEHIALAEWRGATEISDAILVASKSDTARLNLRIHQERLRSGKVSQVREIKLNNGNSIELGIGEVVLFTKEVPGYSISTHQRGIITGFDEAFGCALVTPIEKNGKIEREIPLYFPLPEIQYGYAIESDALAAQPQKQVIWYAHQEDLTSLVTVLHTEDKVIKTIYCPANQFETTKDVLTRLRQHQLPIAKPKIEVSSEVGQRFESALTNRPTLDFPN